MHCSSSNYEVRPLVKPGYGIFAPCHTTTSQDQVGKSQELTTFNSRTNILPGELQESTLPIQQQEFYHFLGTVTAISVLQSKLQQLQQITTTTITTNTSQVMKSLLLQEKKG